MGGCQIFRIQGEWPMSDNDIFQGGGVVQTPEDTMETNKTSRLESFKTYLFKYLNIHTC